VAPPLASVIFPNRQFK